MPSGHRFPRKDVRRTMKNTKMLKNSPPQSPKGRGAALGNAGVAALLAALMLPLSLIHISP